VEFSRPILAATETQPYQFFHLFIEVPLTQKIIIRHMYCFLRVVFFQIQLDVVESAVFFQTVKDRKTDWKSCQCPECVCNDHSIKIIQITCDSCKKQSY
jgi:hypothetical protein